MTVSAEFLCFHGIWRNSILASDIEDKYGIFWWSSGCCTVCIHEFTTKYMTATWALMGEILKILSSAYLKYCQLVWYTDCICQLQLPATNAVYLVGFRGHRKLISICGKFAGVSCGAEFGKLARRISKNLPRKNCSPYLSTVQEISVQSSLRALLRMCYMN